MLLDTGDGRTVSDYDLGINPRDRRTSIEELKKKEEKAKQILESLQTTLNKKENEWRKAGLSESEIDAMRLDFVRKYCEELGLDSVETRLVLEKIEEAQRKGNTLGNQGQQKADKPWYERARDKIVESIDWVGGKISDLLTLVKDNIGNILTGLAFAAMIVGLVALGGAIASAAGIGGLMAAISIGTLKAIAGVSALVSSAALLVKAVAGYNFNSIDIVSMIGNAIIFSGLAAFNAVVEIAVIVISFISNLSPIITNLESLTENDIRHILDPKHLWDKVVDDVNWESVKEVIQLVIENGVEGPYKSVRSFKYEYMGQIIEITGQWIDDIFHISDGWIKR